MRRTARLREMDRPDPDTQAPEIYRITVAHEFAWDMTESLSFALCTYAVPSIGSLLARTGELTHRTRKRYEDPALILEAVLGHGLDSGTGRAGIRRMNQVHGAYDISPDDIRYVLSTFVVVPQRWLAEYGWRPLTGREIAASIVYYRGLGTRMDLRDLPTTFEGWAGLMDDYEREHFAYDEGAREVAEATLRLLADIPPMSLLRARLVRTLSLSPMDDPLLDAFRLPHPPRAVRAGPRRPAGAGPAAAAVPRAPPAEVGAPGAAHPRLPGRLRRRRAGHLPPLSHSSPSRPRRRSRRGRPAAPAASGARRCAAPPRPRGDAARPARRAAW